MPRLASTPVAEFSFVPGFAASEQWQRITIYFVSTLIDALPMLAKVGSPLWKPPYPDKLTVDYPTLPDRNTIDYPQLSDRIAVD
ncbi:hypothetical protein [Rivularia sp. UHCC 0363]|uniref:hypothetical protein n=1 Tax=Rivularia sp. UHCC 0363 TaxID=3110244 RepID=UPI002B20878A|nr:hypothetical protein [Rivularia sp. UHCC 0363]MEA5599258.1 hypothetical protein [Rivularia sp. UHCC 0363]